MLMPSPRLSHPLPQLCQPCLWHVEGAFWGTREGANGPNDFLLWDLKRCRLSCDWHKRDSGIQMGCWVLVSKVQPGSHRWDLQCCPQRRPSELLSWSHLPPVLMIFWLPASPQVVEVVIGALRQVGWGPGPFPHWWVGLWGRLSFCGILPSLGHDGNKQGTRWGNPMKRQSTSSRTVAYVLVNRSREVRGILFRILTIGQQGLNAEGHWLADMGACDGGFWDPGQRIKPDFVMGIDRWDTLHRVREESGHWSLLSAINSLLPCLAIKDWMFTCTPGLQSSHLYVLAYTRASNCPQSSILKLLSLIFGPIFTTTFSIISVTMYYIECMWHYCNESSFPLDWYGVN